MKTYMKLVNKLSVVQQNNDAVIRLQPFSVLQAETHHLVVGLRCGSNFFFFFFSIRLFLVLLLLLNAWFLSPNLLDCP